jgi:hypothetical protein
MNKDNKDRELCVLWGGISFCTEIVAKADSVLQGSNKVTFIIRL